MRSGYFENEQLMYELDISIIIGIALFIREISIMQMLSLIY